MIRSTKEYVLSLSENSKVYVRFSTSHGLVTEFVVKLLCADGEEWQEILRYDSGHDTPHKDILDVEGNVVRKVWYDFLDNGQALTMAISDIRDNYEVYIERYRKWQKE